MQKHNQVKKSQPDRSTIKTVKESLSHLTVIVVISVAGHFATASLSPLVGGVGASLVAPVGGMFLI